ncbi:hypothetical protein RFI_04668 [Reticulomyxa filosa]|uniref:JmjC domain-containing protein n=1 Tax=Reticulomyxa filosa TaxID=46433 RepID=X6P2T7_RETFI|nr:hypothetical protein RFI_04668 [Reticulomyxa filosa]|eukprot:ETO32448.1 hypothetical protein RFI_04668 [Reticulomyxa filosa]
MLFTTFGWHYEDHYTFSVNYNHYGAVKQWYGVPGLQAGELEKALKQYLPHLFEKQPDILYHLVTHVSPKILKQQGVNVFKIRQAPGEFVITFPQAYHCGLNLGVLFCFISFVARPYPKTYMHTHIYINVKFNVAEAVNFATSDWLAYGLKCVNRYRLFGRRQAFPHSELVCKLVNKCEKLDNETLDGFGIILSNITRGRPWDFDPTEYAAHKEDVEELEKQKLELDGI